MYENITELKHGKCPNQMRIYYSRTSLIRTPTDGQNAFVLSGVRINRVPINEVPLYISLLSVGSEIIFPTPAHIQAPAVIRSNTVFTFLSVQN